MFIGAEHFAAKRERVAHHSATLSQAHLIAKLAPMLPEVSRMCAPHAVDQASTTRLLMWGGFLKPSRMDLHD